MGDPDRGFGVAQPGGWAYNISPFLEQGNLRQVGAGGTGPAKAAALATLRATPVPTFYCPSRRAPTLYEGNKGCVNADNPPGNLMAKTDYAGNAGNAGDHLAGYGILEVCRNRPPRRAQLLDEVPQVLLAKHRNRAR